MDSRTKFTGKEIAIEIIEDSLSLNFNRKKDFLQTDCEEIIVFLNSHANNKMFKIIEIDFGSTFFEITDLMDKLIKNSHLFRKNKQSQVVLNLGKLDLESRIGYLRCLRKLNINNYEINYFKKSNLVSSSPYYL